MAPLHKEILIATLLALMSHRILARSMDYEFIIPRQELLAIEDVDSSEEAYNDLKKHTDNDPMFLSEWPWLRELVPEPLPTVQPQKRMSPPHVQMNSIKPNEQKKGSNTKSRQDYMTKCHFKICNMGRKRNVRFVHF